MSKFFSYPPSSAGASQYYKDGSLTSVGIDTVTPANSNPMPAQLLDSSGVPVDFNDIGVDIKQINNVPVDAGAGNSSLGTQRVILAADQDVIPIKIHDESDNPIDYNFGAVGAQTIRTAAQIGNATGAADFGSGVLSAQTIRTVIASDQPAFSVADLMSVRQGTGAAATAPWSTRLSDGTSFYDAAKYGQFPATLGQSNIAGSLSVTIASDQPNINVTQGSPTTPFYVRQSDGTNHTAIKQLSAGLAGTDYATVVQSVIHGLSTGGGGVYVDVKVTPSGSLVTATDITQINSAAPSATNAFPARLTDGTAYYKAPVESQLPATLGQKTMANSLAVVIASDQSEVKANISQIAGTATSVNTGNADAGTQRVAIATDQPAIATKSPINAAGSNTDSTVSTVATLTAPANAVGFILMNLDTSGANIRWRIGAVATSSAGQQLQPGRDTGFIPCAANISVCAESGTQNYNVQWILSS